MSIPEGSATSTPGQPTRDQEGQATIASKVPPWLLQTTRAARRSLHAQGRQALPRVGTALQQMPEVVARLQDDYREHTALGVQVEAWLKAVPDPERFAEPLLKAALRERFGREVDVRQTWLFHPRRMRTDDSFLAASRDWAVESFKAFRLACRPLLGMALQNFEAWETEPGGMDLPLTRARIIQVTPGRPLWEGETLDIPAEAFAALCRELDLGGQYQQRIAETFDPPHAPGRHAILERHEQSGLLLHLHLARIGEQVGQPLYEALRQVLQEREASIDGVPVRGVGLTLWDIELNGIVLFGGDLAVSDLPAQVVAWIPGDPAEPLREHGSLLAFGEHLRDRLLNPEYLKFFQRFVPRRHRARFLDKLQRTLHPKVWNAGGWYEERVDRQALLPFRRQSLDTPLMPALLARKLAGLKDDGLFLAVPSAAQDHKSLEEKLEYFAQAGLLAVNVLAFAVPLVGAAMMVFSVAQLAHEVYEGIGEWLQDEREQAWTYLLDVLENLAQLAILGTAAAQVPRLPDALHPVRLASGGTRLWTRDLKPFAHAIVLPAGLTADARGLYAYQGKRWLSLDGRNHAVAVRDDGSAYLEHPRRADAYQPALRYNGGGVWLHELDRPREWSGLELFRRLGAPAAGLDELQARRLLRISGCHEAVLRRTLVDGQRPPALLLDSLARWQIDRELAAREETLSAEHHARLFQALYQAAERPLGATQAVLSRDFPSLPRRVLEELVEHASPAERVLLDEQQKVPPRLAEEARLYLQNLRLARAYEGLYLMHPGNDDSTRLSLHSLAGLAGWAEQYRVEIRGLRADGPLLDSIGPTPAVHVRVLVKSAEGYRTAEEPQVPAGELLEVLLRTLTSVQRKALGMALTDTSSVLRLKVQARPLERPALRKVLHMQPIRPAKRSPMRLADGRPGYALSGRGRLAPFISENTLLDRIRLLELPDIFASELLQQLRTIGLDDTAIDTRLSALLEEREQLQQALPLGEEPQLADSQASLSDRHLIELALWQHWRDNLLPEIGRSGVPLRLFAVSLENVPEQLPGFFRSRVRALELSRVGIPAAVTSPDADGLLRHEDRLLQLLRSFPQVTALEIDTAEGRSLHDLPRTIVEACPQLSELRLLNLHLTLDQQVLDQLWRLDGLRHLDLSGNRPSHLPVMLGDSPPLQFLGLDRLGLEHWPDWLDSEMLYSIERISLRDNRLTGLPAYLRVNPANAGRETWISLRGNLFSHQSLIGIRASTWHGRRFRFDLEIPRSVEDAVAAIMGERDTLAAAIDAWLALPADDTRLAARRVLGESLRSAWAARLDGGPRSLALEDLRLEDFPQALPDFYFQRTSGLELIRPLGTAAQFDALLGRFGRLEHLSISGVHLGGLPASLAGLSTLRSLVLSHAGLLVDQAMIDALGRMTGLSALDLSGNRLGEITHSAVFGRLSLHRLNLQRMQIEQWPGWLDGLLPERIQWLNLNHNRLSTLPAWLLQNAESASGSTEISLEDNPLSEDVMHSAHLSEGFTRPYTFRMDLPEHIRRLGSSWRGSSSVGGSSTATSDTELLNVDSWLEPGRAGNELRRQLWRQLESTDDTDDLLRLIGRLRHTAEYRNAATRPDLIERVWQVLTISAQDPELRLTLNGMAEEPLSQLSAFDTCPDGIRLEFNQMEILVYTGQALRAVTTEQRGPALYRLMRRLYRLHELDAIARVQAGSRDEAEVRLAYRLSLANLLDLPLAPEQMLYAGSASLHSGELERAAARVLEGESGQGLLDYAAQRDFWLGYLRETYAGRFKAMREAFEAQVLGLDDRYPDDTPVQASARIQALVDQRKLDELALIGELTHREGLLVDQG